MPITQECFLPTLVEIGQVVLEKNSDDGQQTMDNGCYTMA